MNMITDWKIKENINHSHCRTTQCGNPSVVGKGFEIEKEMKCGLHTWRERWFVVRSDSHAQCKNQARTKRLKKVETALNQLTPKKEEELSHFSNRACSRFKEIFSWKSDWYSSWGNRQPEKTLS
jgi:hypothetical protein